MSIPREMVTFEASTQPGPPRNPTKLESAAGRASSLTTVPTGNHLSQVPAPFPRVMVQLMPAGCDVIVPLPPPPGTIPTPPLLQTRKRAPGLRR